MEHWPSLAALEADVVECRRCPRLVAWREQVAEDKRAAFEDEDYWGRPVPGFGDPDARLLIVGLAPAAHGANRTGRMFTGDRSGDWLYAALHRAGFANQPTSTHRGDGLELDGAWVTAPVRCAPPDNRPTTDERDECLPYLLGEIRLLPFEVIVALGGFAWDILMREVDRPVPKPRFGHGEEVAVTTRDEDPRDVTLLGSYHPSQQNTFTGRLTEEMLDAVFGRSAELLGRETP
ncbi:MAG: uracil-DNA glycosylase [Actinobacteria bacterium]|nr:uracil-DNA glycosylase [Actinomycetota bacterium]